MNPHSDLEKIIRIEIRRQYQAEIDGMKSAIKKMEDKIAALETALNRKIEYVNGRVSAVKTDVEENKQNNKQLVALEEQMHSLVVSTIEEKIQPQINMMRVHFEEKTLDGTQVITDYRNRVMGVANSKLLTSGDAKRDFQSSMFAFTDDD